MERVDIAMSEPYYSRLCYRQPTTCADFQGWGQQSTMIYLGDVMRQCSSSSVLWVSKTHLDELKFQVSSVNFQVTLGTFHGQEANLRLVKSLALDPPGYIACDNDIIT